MYQYPQRSDELYHYGVKGMRWSKGHQYIKRVGDKLYYAVGGKEEKAYDRARASLDFRKERYDYVNERKKLQQQLHGKGLSGSEENLYNVRHRSYKEAKSRFYQKRSSYEKTPLGRIHKAVRKTKEFINSVYNKII